MITTVMRPLPLSHHFLPVYNRSNMVAFVLPQAMLLPPLVHTHFQLLSFFSQIPTLQTFPEPTAIPLSKTFQKESPIVLPAAKFLLPLLSNQWKPVLQYSQRQRDSFPTPAVPVFPLPPDLFLFDIRCQE